ncbi:MAG: type II secretion system F family protein [Rhodobacteraceae bacterium]|nr:type II secretion system F family protein [Paracoccaceae bacterium]
MGDLLSSNPLLAAIVVVALVGLSISALAYALFQPMLSGDRQKQERFKAISTQTRRHEELVKTRDGDSRRKSVQQQLKEFEQRQQKKNIKQNKPSLSVRMEQAGLSWSKKQYYYFSAGCGVALPLFVLLLTNNLFVLVAVAFVGVFGVPAWTIGFLRKRRFNAFLEEFPSAIDIIVRGVKAGLPLGDCVKIVAREASEPVAGEFRQIVDKQVMGLPLADAIMRMPDRIPLAEANFFAIVISIQQKSGGGLAEALGNLSKVLRSRKVLKRKVQALSSEAKSSAGIIGSLPFIVTGVLATVAPDYIMLLFERTTGHIIIGVSLTWMFIGIMVMRKMIHFDF